MLRPHAKVVFFTRAMGGMRWRNNMEINAESGYARVLTDHQNSDLQMDALSTAGWKKNIGHIPGEPGRKYVRPAKELRWGSTQQAAIMDMQEWLRHPTPLIRFIPVKLYSYPERVAHGVIVTLGGLCRNPLLLDRIYSIRCPFTQSILSAQIVRIESMMLHFLCKEVPFMILIRLENGYFEM